MNPQALYVIGAPGAGKTTVLQAALADVKATGYNAFATVLVGPHVWGWELGRRRETFSGTDALAMDAQPRVQEAIAAAIPPVLVGEGDRLANEKFFDFLRLRGYNLQVVLLETPGSVCAERRAARNSQQNEAWIRGRVTKVLRLASLFGAQVVDGAQPVQLVAKHLRGFWAISALRGGQPAYLDGSAKVQGSLL